MPFGKILYSENSFGMLTQKFNERSWAGHPGGVVARWGPQCGQLLSATIIQTIIRMRQPLRPSWEREKLLQPKVEIKRLEIRSKQLGKCIPEQNEKPITALFLLSCQ